MGSNLTPAARALLKEFEADLMAQAITVVSVQQYVGKVRRFLRFLGKKDVLAANQETLKAYLAHLLKGGMQATTVMKQFVAISSLFVFLEAEGRVGANPVPTFRRRYLKVLKREAGKTEIAVRQLLSVDDMRRVVHALVDARDRAALVLLAKTGMRPGELLSIDVEDVDWNAQSLRLKKKRKRTNKTVFFDDETARVLKRWLVLRKARGASDTGPLFTGALGGRLNRHALADAIRAAAQGLGLDDPEGPIEKQFTPHCGRHFFTTHLRRAGMTREHVGFLRGDAPRGTMDIYLHIDPDEVKESYLARVPKFGI